LKIKRLQNQIEKHQKKFGMQRKKVDEKVDETDFEETRRCLLTSYYSYVQTHAGYIIALIIGFVAIIATFESSIIATFESFIKIGT
jgi:hypothetical protein